MKNIMQYYFDTPSKYDFGPLLDGGNYKDFAHREFMLPTSTEILQTAEKLGRENTIKHFLDKYNGKQGVKMKVADVLSIPV